MYYTFIFSPENEQVEWVLNGRGFYFLKLKNKTSGVPSPSLSNLQHPHRFHWHHFEFKWFSEIWAARTGELHNRSLRESKVIRQLEFQTKETSFRRLSVRGFTTSESFFKSFYSNRPSWENVHRMFIYFGPFYPFPFY